MRNLSTRDVQDAGLLVAKMAASGAEPIAVIVVGIDRKASELSAGTLWLKQATGPEIREAVAQCAKASIIETGGQHGA